MAEPLIGFESSAYSQHGEDGVIAEVLRRIGQEVELDRWCVEVGAWDGVLWSNTARLILEEDYSAVLIGGDQHRAAALTGAHPGHTVVGVGAFVGFEDDERLDAILSSTPAPTTFDLLSPKVVVIEYNPAIPNSVKFVQARDPSVHHGTSAAALVGLAHGKGTCSLRWSRAISYWSPTSTRTSSWARLGPLLPTCATTPSRFDTSSPDTTAHCSPARP